VIFSAARRRASSDLDSTSDIKSPINTMIIVRSQIYATVL